MRITFLREAEETNLNRYNGHPKPKQTLRLLHKTFGYYGPFICAQVKSPQDQETEVKDIIGVKA